MATDELETEIDRRAYGLHGLKIEEISAVEQKLHCMKTTIAILTLHDLDAVDKLMVRHSRTIGFLTRETLKVYLEKECVLGAKTANGRLIGYLLYGAYPNRFRISQICVSEKFQGQGITRQLVDQLKASATNQKVIELRCRRDFPAHSMWPKLGFIPLDERPGRSLAGHPLTLWQLTLAPKDQLSLFQANASDETRDVAIDAQIVFDLDEPDSAKTAPSKALLADFLVDSLSFWITDELFVEIDRQQDGAQRRKARQRAHEFSKVECDSQSAEHFEAVIRPLFTSNTASKQSDIRHLAKVAASDISTFVTRDRVLLEKSADISALTNVQVISPTELSIQLHEQSNGPDYAPTRVSGPDLKWRRFALDDFASFPFTSLLNKGERQGQFREKLEPFLARTDHYECEILLSGDGVAAIRVLSKSFDKALTVHLSRVVHSTDRSLFQSFLVADTVEKAVAQNLGMVKFEKTFLDPSFKPSLLKIGFTECPESFVRFCFALSLDRQEVSSTIAELCPESISNYLNLSDLELERYCSPLSLEEAREKYFLVPVRPGYAMSLVDRGGAADDLFGGNISVLLRWDNVYYRKKTLHRILQPPARILWYVTGNQNQIVAASHLDEVQIGAAKELFKKFKKIGVLAWNDIYEMCKGDPSNEIMAVQFSHTFPFRKPLSLDSMRAVFQENGTGLWLQSASRLSATIFHKLFQLGYPNP